MTEESNRNIYQPLAPGFSVREGRTPYSLNRASTSHQGGLLSDAAYRLVPRLAKDNVAVRKAQEALHAVIEKAQDPASASAALVEALQTAGEKEITARRAAEQEVERASHILAERQNWKKLLDRDSKATSGHQL